MVRDDTCEELEGQYDHTSFDMRMPDHNGNTLFLSFCREAQLISNPLTNKLGRL